MLFDQLQKFYRGADRNDWKSLLNYWRSKQSADLLPSRRDIDPVIEIPRLAPRLFLIDVDERRYRWRLIGSGVVSKIDQDITGRRIGSGHTPLDEMVPFLDKIVVLRDPLLLSVPLDQGFASRMLVLMMPLIGEDRRVEMVFGGAFDWEGEDLSWIGSERIKEISIDVAERQTSQPRRQSALAVRRPAILRPGLAAM
jgi:hypothetical protein